MKKLRIYDLTIIPIIGGEKQKWLFRCENCGFEAIFIIYKGQGISTTCELCGGDMIRIKKWEEIKMYKKLEKPYDEIILENGAKQKPLVSLKDEYGGELHICLDDKCYVLCKLYGEQSTPEGIKKTYIKTYWWPAEAIMAIFPLIAKK
ncbi:MAG: hypothetical protein J7L26_12615 [Candidatus Aminicenantes bacterium]|nr:hypothetical protein [Candidatus Aminicenantes bacterium]